MGLGDLLLADLRVGWPVLKAAMLSLVSFDAFGGGSFAIGLLKST